MSAHTPGPWRWHGYYLMQDVPSRDGEEGRETNPFSTPCGHPIADDGSAGGEYNVTIDTQGPDARLIAAAPDLLDELRTARAVIATACGESAPFARIALARIDAALAKAEARS